MRVQIITIGLVLLFVSSASFALIGPPTAELDKGQWSIGGNYTYTSQDLDDVKGKNSDGDKTSHGLEDFNINRYYGQLGYGLADNWELYGQLGIADIKLAFIESDGSESCYNYDNDIFYGLGTKYTFAKQEKVNWGAALWVNILNPSYSDTYTQDDGEGGTETVRESLDDDVMEIALAVGPTVDMGACKLYGGALYSLVSYEFDYKLRGPDWIWKSTGDSDTNNFGGYIGAEFDMYKNCNAAIEFLATNNGWGAGVGIEIPF
jgi:hypothetical protein